MTTLAKIRTHHINARKARDPIISNLLGTVIAECEQAASRGKVAHVLTENEVIGIVLKMSSNIDETLTTIQNVPDRSDEHAKLTREAEALAGYLPTKLTDEELRQIAIRQDALGFNLGKIMGYLKSEYFGRYDAKTATDIIKQVLESETH